ncbi:YraN family protein [Thalassotalea maritima]|uniref:YraN family protein n=1 Tax=Thalassotalea maritima TaxID=3242416 RepID=UPI0035272F88
MIWNKPSTRSLGQLAEKVALNYLKQQGLKYIQANFQCKMGEIDLIMQSPHGWVFVEVKYRHHRQFAAPEASVDSRKMAKIIKTAQFFLQKNNLSEYNSDCRFDVITISGDLHSPDINWHKNAFYGE